MTAASSCAPSTPASVMASVRLATGVTFAEFLDGGQTIAAGDSAAGVDRRERQRPDHRSPAARRGLADVTRLDAQAVVDDDAQSVRLQIWDVRTNSPKLERTPVIPNGVHSVRFSADRASAFLCGLDGGALAVVGRAIEPTRLGTDSNCLSLRSFRRRAARGDCARQRHRARLVREWRRVHAQAASRRGCVVGRVPPREPPADNCDSDGVIRAWELGPSARWARTVNRGYTWSVSSARTAQHPGTGQRAASPPYTGQATVLDAVTGEKLLPPLRHGGNVRFATFNRDGIIATASDDGTARLWDTSTGEPLSGELRHAVRSGDGVGLQPRWSPATDPRAGYSLVYERNPVGSPERPASRDAARYRIGVHRGVQPGRQHFVTVSPGVTPGPGVANQ